MQSSLRVTADGALVVARDGNDLQGVDSRAVRVRWRACVYGLREHLIVGSEVWAVIADAVIRFDVATGVELGRRELPQGDGPIAATSWLPGTLARAGDAACTLTFGSAACLADLSACELALPLGPGMFVVARDEALALERGGRKVWSTRLPGERATHGAIILEGRAAAVCMTRTHAPEHDRIVVINVRDGAILHALATPEAIQVAFAPRRGWAVVRREGSRVTVVDLRLGRVVGLRDAGEPIHDIVADDVFDTIAVRIGVPARLAIMTSAELLAPGAELAESAPEVTTPGSDIEPAAIEVTATPAPPRAPSGPLLGLASPRTGVPASPHEAAIGLEAQLRWIGALVEHAIARDWDSGRIAAPAVDTLPFEHEVVATLHDVHGRAAAQLARALKHVEHCRRVLVDVERARDGRHTPLSRLADELGLGSLAVDVLLAIAAPLLWGELARLYGILANDRARPLCDELLLSQLLGPHATRGEIARELDPDRPLRRFGLIVLDDGLLRPFGALVVAPTILSVLRGVDAEIAADGVTVRRATVSLDAIRIDPAVRDRAIAALAAPRAAAARVALRGRPSSGRRTLAAALSARCERPIAIVDASSFAHDLELRCERLGDELLRCRALGWIPCVQGLDDIAVADHPDGPALANVLGTHPGPLFLRLPADAAVPLDPGYVCVDLAVLSETARVAGWSEALRGYGLPADSAADLGARYRVGPGVVVRAAEMAATALRAESNTEPAVHEVQHRVDTAVRQHIEDRLGTTATRVTRLAGWADLVLPQDVLDSLLELVARIRRRRIVFETWGFDRRVTSARGVTALFQGGPGTGKTLAAGVIARELGLDLYRIDLARVVSKWIGETQKNLASVFDAAEDGQAALLFDEADSLFAKRTDVKSSVDRYANLEVNYLLQRLDSFEGIALLTTNLGTSIDPAFKRRMSMRLTFPFPDEEMREQLWRAHVPPEVPRVGTIDFAKLARRFSLSGGYIRNAALRAAFLAAEEGVGLSQPHLERAIRLEFREVGKLSETGALE